MQFLAAAAVLLASYGAGSGLTVRGRIVPGGELRRAATVFAAGYVALALLAFVLGLAGAFRPALLVAIALALGAVGLVAVALDAPAAVSAWRGAGRERWLLAVAAAVVLVDVLLAGAPPTSGDALAYHLTAPKLWLDSGEIGPLWWNWEAFQPFSAEMHFAYALALDGGAAATVVGAGLSGLGAVAVYGLARELAGNTPAAVATLLWVGQGAFLWEATGAFVELIVAGLLALAAWHLVVLARSRRPADAALAGLALGAAAGTKYHALLFVPVALVAAAWLTRRIAPAALLGVLALVAAPWYVRNWIVADNPFYPIAFGGRFWSAADDAYFDALWAPYGLDGLWRLPLFPLWFLLEHERYERGYAFGAALFLLAPVGAALAWRHAWTKVFAAGLAVYLVVWWEAMYQITRYLLPVMPFAAVLAGVAAVELWRRRRWAPTVVLAAGALGVVPLVAITALYTRQVLPAAVGLEPRDEFVQRLTGTYDAFTWLEEELPAGGTLAVGGVRNLFWLDRPYIRLTPPLVDAVTGESGLERIFGDEDVSYFVILDGRPRDVLAMHSRRLATLAIPRIESRTLGTAGLPGVLNIYAWCPAATHPCS